MSKEAITPEEEAFWNDTEGDAPESSDREIDSADDEPESEVAQESAEAVEPETEPEPEPEPEAEEKAPKGYVKIGALHEARNEMRVMRDEMNVMQQNLQQMNVLREQLNQLRISGQQDQQKIAQKELEQQYADDPIEFLRKQNAELVDRINYIQNQQESVEFQRQQFLQRQQQMGQLIDHVNALENQFRKQHSDYDEAFQFLQQRRMGDYQRLGINDEAQRNQNFHNEIMNVSANSIQNGQNPSEIIYELAKSWGWQSNAGRQAADNIAKIETVRKGQTVSKSLSQGGTGGGEDPEVSIADISRMTDEEFDAYWAKLEGKG